MVLLRCFRAKRTKILSFLLLCTAGAKARKGRGRSGSPGVGRRPQDDSGTTRVSLGRTSPLWMDHSPARVPPDGHRPQSSRPSFLASSLISVPADEHRQALALPLHNSTTQHHLVTTTHGEDCWWQSSSPSPFRERRGNSSCSIEEAMFARERGSAQQRSRSQDRSPELRGSAAKRGPGPEGVEDRRHPSAVRGRASEVASSPAGLLAGAGGGEEDEEPRRGALVRPLPMPMAMVMSPRRGRPRVDRIGQLGVAPLSASGATNLHPTAGAAPRPFQGRRSATENHSGPVSASPAPVTIPKHVARAPQGHTHWQLMGRVATELGLFQVEQALGTQMYQFFMDVTFDGLNKGKNLMVRVCCCCGGCPARRGGGGAVDVHCLCYPRLIVV